MSNSLLRATALFSSSWCRFIWRRSAHVLHLLFTHSATVEWPYLLKTFFCLYLLTLLDIISQMNYVFIFLWLKKLALLSMLQINRAILLSDFKHTTPTTAPPQPVGESWRPLPGRCFLSACAVQSCIVHQSCGQGPAAGLGTDTFPPTPQHEYVVQSAPIAPLATILSVWMGTQHGTSVQEQQE